jgi:hypothetical protein
MSRGRPHVADSISTCGTRAEVRRIDYQWHLAWRYRTPDWDAGSRFQGSLDGGASILPSWRRRATDVGCVHIQKAQLALSTLKRLLTDASLACLPRRMAAWACPRRVGLLGANQGLRCPCSSALASFARVVPPRVAWSTVRVGRVPFPWNTLAHGSQKSSLSHCQRSGAETVAQSWNSALDASIVLLCYKLHCCLNQLWQIVRQSPCRIMKLGDRRRSWKRGGRATKPPGAW